MSVNLINRPAIVIPTIPDVSAYEDWTAKAYDAEDAVDYNGGVFRKNGDGPSVTPPMDNIGSAGDTWRWVSGTVTVADVASIPNPTTPQHPPVIYVLSLVDDNTDYERDDFLNLYSERV